MKVLERNNQKRLAMYININIHCTIRKIVAQKNEKISEWVREAIMEKIEKEKELGFET